MIQRELRIFLTAVMFYTRLPFSTGETPSKEDLKHTSRYFPLIGWLAGAVGAFVIWGGSAFWPLPLAVLVSMTATILLTGALHEDGFSDVCDGFGGGWTQEDILRIMKDSNTGVFGVTGLILLLGLKFLSLISLRESLLPMALISAHSLSRFAAISFMYSHDYVRKTAESKVKSVVQRMSLNDLVFAGFFGIAPFAIMNLLFPQRWGFMICLITVWAARWGLGQYFTRWIGGYTGDCLGAVQQVTEVVFYMTLATVG